MTTQENDTEQTQLSLSTDAARNLATTTKTVPQMQAISSRWLLRILPWVEVKGGTYRVNRRLSYAVGDGRVSFTISGGRVQIIPPELTELPPLRGFDDQEALRALAERFSQQEYPAGDLIVEAGGAADQVILIAHGKAAKLGQGPYGDQTSLGVLTDGDHVGAESLGGEETTWDYSIRAVTGCTVMTLSRRNLGEFLDQSPGLREHIDEYQARPQQPQNEQGEAVIELASGHAGEPVLAGAFADYELRPREYELSVAQTVLRVHTRVADLYNDPMNQVAQQLRLTVEALRERQEHELVNNPDIGLLHNAELKQRISTRTGPPTPDDLDELLTTVWKNPGALLAHPQTIAAFGRECTSRGIYPQNTDLLGRQVLAWRGVPLLPCNKIPISGTRTSSILLMRLGEQDQGVIGLHQVGIPDEIQPSLSARFMGVNDQAVLSYLVSAYYSLAVLVPDALGVLENVEIGVGG